MQVVATSAFVDADGPVHVTDFGGPADGPVVVCVHGLRSSSVGWAPFAERLTGSARVLAVDLPGHGRSPAAGRSLAVPDTAQVLARVLEELDLPPVTLVGHSMGAAVSVLTASTAQTAVDRLLLLSPPMPRQGVRIASRAVLPQVAVCLWPRVGLLALQRKVARLTVEQYVADNLRVTCATDTDLTQVASALTTELQEAFDRGDEPLASFVEAARSIGLFVAEGRRYREALASVSVPTQVVHGALDRVLDPRTLGVLDQLQPTWPVDLLPGVGHCPHLEEPGACAQTLRALWDDPASVVRTLAPRRPALPLALGPAQVPA